VGVLDWIGALGRKKNTECSLGALGESAAVEFLKKAKFRIIARNVRLPIGEIDVLAESPDRCTVVVVEVKSRVVSAGHSERLPERAITAAKGRKLASLAKAVSRKKSIAGRPVRIDVVAVEFSGSAAGPKTIRHYPNAIDANGRRV